MIFCTPKNITQTQKYLGKHSGLLEYLKSSPQITQAGLGAPPAFRGSRLLSVTAAGLPYPQDCTPQQAWTKPAEHKTLPNLFLSHLVEYNTNNHQPLTVLALLPGAHLVLCIHFLN